MPFFFREKKLKAALCWFILLMAANSADAQRFRAILQGGANLSQVDGDGLAGYNKPGLAGGIQTNAVLSNRWEWSLGIAFSQQGARNALDNPAAAIEAIKLNTIEMPIMLHFNEWKFQLGAGGAFNRLISGRVIDVTGADVSDLQNLRENQFSALVECKVFLKENSGFGLRWYKNLFNIKSDRASGAWIGRTINLHAFMRL
jgi:hypothetical protein